MNDFRISPDDPKLTAYALGELHDAERAEVEAAIADDPAAQAAVAQIRAFAAHLASSLVEEANADPIEPAPRQPANVLVAPRAPLPPTPRVNGHRATVAEPRTPKLLQFPQLYYVIGSLAAACFAVMIALRTPKVSPPSKHPPEVTVLPPSAASGTVAVAAPAPDNVSTPATTSESTLVAATQPDEPVTVPPPTQNAELAFKPRANAAIPSIGSFRLSDELKTVNRVAAAPPISLLVSDEPAAIVRIDVVPPRPMDGISELVALRHAALVTTDRGAVGARRTPYYYPPDEKFVIPVEPMPHASVIKPPPRTPAFNAFAWDWDQGRFNPPPGLLFGKRLPSTAIAPFGPLDLLPGPAAAKPRYNLESYALRRDNAFVSPAAVPFSTFAVHVDTGSYASLRRLVADGHVPPAESVQIEELLNYFPYHYAAPSRGDRAPIAAALEVASAPWAPTHRLVRIGLKGRIVDQPSGTLTVVAKALKIQVDFNPARVASYRLIGYEARPLATAELHNDAADDEDLVAGKTVTALYEVIPVGAADGPVAAPPPIDAPRYASAPPPLSNSDPIARELLAVKVRYKDPNGDSPQKLEFPLVDAGAKFEEASDDFKFAAAVAEFGMILRHSSYRGEASMADVIAWAAAGSAAPSSDPGGYRGEFLDLARRTQTLLQ